jgi:hypothetical protein
METTTVYYSDLGSKEGIFTFTAQDYYKAVFEYHGITLNNPIEEIEIDYIQYLSDKVEKCVRLWNTKYDAIEDYISTHGDNDNECLYNEAIPLNSDEIVDMLKK